MANTILARWNATIMQQGRVTDALECLGNAYSTVTNKGVNDLPAARGDDIVRAIPGLRAGPIILEFYDIPVDSDEYLAFCQDLSFIASRAVVRTKVECLRIYVNIIRSSFPEYDKELTQIFNDYGYQVRILDPEETLQHFEDLSPNYRDSGDFQALDLDASTLHTLIPIYWNFITKKVSNANFTGWFNGRRNAYSSISLADADDASIDIMKPDIEFASNVNSSMGGVFRFKTFVFLRIRDASRANAGLLTEIAKTTMSYFKMTEMTVFAMIYENILIKNPIFLAWNGLAKELPYLTSALKAYRELGDDGPYLKLLLDPRKTEAFQQRHLTMFSIIAQELERIEGSKSMNNYQGVTTGNVPPNLLEKCKEIVSLFAGAETKVTYEVKSSILHKPDEVTALTQSLQSGLNEALLGDVNADGGVLNFNNRGMR